MSAFVGELPPLTAEGCKDHVFLSVADPRPEDKFQMGAPQVRSRLRLDVLPWSAWSPGDVLQVVTRTVRAESKTLDAAAFCFQETMEQMCCDILIWKCRPCGLHLQFLPLPQAEPERPRALPAGVLDEDCQEEEALVAAADSEHDCEEEEALVPAADAPLRPSVEGPVPFTQTENRLLQALLQTAGTGACDPLTLPFYDQSAAESLADKQCLQVELDEFGVQCWRVCEAVRLTPQLCLRSPLRLRDLPSDGRGGVRTGMCKLEWVRLLLQTGWRFTDEPPLWMSRKSTTWLPASPLQRPELMLKALLCLPVIWQKRGAPRKIYLAGPAAYYKRLLVESDLTFMKDWTETDICNCSDRKRPVKRGRWARPALADAKSDSDSENGGAPAASSASRPLASAAEPAALMLPGIPQPEPLQVNLPGNPLRVHFDNYTHASGELRAFIACTAHGHGPDCRLYVFVKNHGSRSRAAAFLAAWHELGARSVDADHHKARKPTQAQVEAVLWSQMVPAPAVV
jgi:hypothetical protein